MTPARLRSPAPVRVVFDGQSHNLTPAAPNNMPTVLMWGRGIPWANVAVGGEGWSERDPAALFAQARNLDGHVDILVMNGGQGDIFDQNMTGAQTYAAAEAYRDAALAAGFHQVLVTTMPPIGEGFYGPGVPTPTQLAAIADHNALVLANADDWDAVVDLDVAPLDDPYDTTHYAVDFLHWSPAGAQAAADLIAPVLDALLAETPPASYDDRILATSPWGYWPLSEASGDFADLTGNGRPGTGYGTLTRSVEGPHGALACEFAGSPNGSTTSATRIHVPTAPDFGSDAAWSLSLWMRQASAIDQSHLFGNAASSSGSNYWSVNNRHGTALCIQSRVGTTTTFRPASGSVVAADSNWHHIAVTKANGATGELRFFIDGALVSTATAIASSWGSGGLNIGAMTSSSNRYAFTGRLARVAFYGRTLTDAEAIDLASP